MIKNQSLGNDGIEISLERASFRWNKLEEEDNKNLLNDISFNLKSGDLLFVIGEVGIGKTSLLYSLMNQTF